MSKKKQTPAQVAQTLAAYIAKQEDTLRSFPIGPMSNTARRNLKKGREALALLQGKNEEMRMQVDPNAVPMPQMVLGGESLDAALSKLTPGQRSLYDGIVADGASPDAAMAIVSVTAKESDGDFASVERGYGNTSNKRIREIFSGVKDLSDAELNELKKDDEAFFNKVYGQRMGNDGEGYKYRGRGLIQLTGKNNYAEVSQALFGDDRLVENPDLITQDETVAGQVGSYFLTQGKGIGDIAGVDLSRTDLSPEELGMIADSTYAKVAGKGSIDEVKDRKLFASGTAKQREFLQTVGIETPERPDVEVPRTQMAASPDIAAEEARRAAALREAETQETLAFLNSQTGDQVPQQAAMTAGSAGDGRFQGYLGATYGAESTRAPINVPDFQALELAEGQREIQAQRDATMTPEEQRKEDLRIGVDVLAKDFSYEKVKAWGKKNYGISETADHERNTDNIIIGANTYVKEGDRGQHKIFENGTADLGGTGITVDETRVLLQALVDGGLSEEQAFEALEDRETYRQMKENIPSSISAEGLKGVAGMFRQHTLNMAQGAYENAVKWAKTTENREKLASVVDRGEEGGKNYFDTELAPGVNPEVSVRDAMIEADRKVFLRNNPGRLYLPGRGGTVPLSILDPTSTRTRQIATMEAASQNPLDFRVEPSFIDADLPQAPQALNVLDPSQQDMIPELGGKVEEGTTTVEDVVVKQPESPQVPTEKSAEQEQTTSDPDNTTLDMQGPGLLAAIPALASAASVGIQRRALNQMQAPQRPIISDIPAFNYQSNLGQQLQDVRDSTQAMSRMDGVRGPQAAAARQGLLAQRLRQEQRLRGMDNEAMQQARARYDAMSQQARMAQDAIRTNYQNDLTQFNNQKAMLDAQIKQQPLNVLSATAQDYLKNVYQPNLAAQLEAQGRMYDTTFPNQEEGG